MAALREIESGSERLVLGRGGRQASGNLIGLIIFAAIVCVGLSSVFQEGGPGDLAGLITSLIFGAIILFSIVSAARGTRVVVDASQRLATRTETLFFLPLQKQEVHFNGIKQVALRWTGVPSMPHEEVLPFWGVALDSTGGAPLLVNRLGSHAEMTALAEKLAALINRPVVDELGEQARYPSPPVSPPLSTAPPSMAAQERRPRRRRRETASGRIQPAPPRSRIAPGSEFTAAPDLALGETAGYASMPVVQLENRESAPDYSSGVVMYSAPPLMVMPELPLLFSFPAALDIPTLPPITADNLKAQVTEIPDVGEIVEAEPVGSGSLMPGIADLQRAAQADPTNAPAQYQLARALYATGARAEARAAFERALKTDPVNATGHNDLGVLLYQQGNLNAAEQSFQRALALDPFLGVSRYNLGLLFARTRRARAAREQFKIGLQSAGGSDAARFDDALRGVLADPLLSPNP